jgi:hypothetical protein
VPPVAALNTNIRNPVKPGMPVRRSASQRRPVRSPVKNAAPEQAARRIRSSGTIN